jgi:DNA-binding PadR family transcriptional regulator
MDGGYDEAELLSRGRRRGWGMPGMRGPGRGWGGGRPRTRRGDIRRAVLSALREGAAHGYEIMQWLENRSGGIWRPSPGSVYPTLQMLEDEGLVRSETRDGTRVYQLTDAGRSEADSSEKEGRGGPWDPVAEDADQVRALSAAAAQLNMAARQVATAGSVEQVQRGVEVVNRARTELYKILAES